MSDAPPRLERLGKYELRGVLGRGAMGVVYDGWDPMIERRVAIKTARLPDPDDVEAQEELGRFRREAQAAGRLSHPNIVGVYDSGDMDGIAFFVMELVEGRSLKDMLAADQRFAPAETVRLMEQVLQGLAYSHARGVIHRDIKPANVMVTDAGQAKIADFGIARIESSSMTQTGTVMGTPAYMSPEQFMGETVDSRTDIYSAGVLLYVLLTGERPFEGSITAIMHKVLHTVPPKPSDLSVSVDPALDSVVARAMARRPEDRFPSATAFATALRAAFDAPAGARDDATMIAPASHPTPRPAPATGALAPKRAASRRGALLLAGVLAALALAGGGAWFALPARAPKPPAVVVAEADHAPVQLPDPPDPAASDTPAAQSQDALPPLRPPTDEAQVATVFPPVASPDPSRDAAPNVAPDPAIVRAVANDLRHAPCSLTQTTGGTDGVVIGGMAGEVGLDTLRLMVAPSLAGAQLRFEVDAVDPRYCRTIDLIRDIAQPGDPAFSLELKGGRQTLHSEDDITPVLTLPDAPMYLRLDYFSSDGQVFHYSHQAGIVDRKQPAGAMLEPLIGKAAEPFGSDLVTAIVSTAPLPVGARRDSEPADAYLAALRTAIDGVRKRGGKVGGRAVMLTTMR